MNEVRQYRWTLRDMAELNAGGWEDLSSMGLRVRYRDGSDNVFVGVLRYPGEWTHEAVLRFCEEAQAVVYVPAREDA